MPCKSCHETMPRNPRDEFCSDICRVNQLQLDLTIARAELARVTTERDSVSETSDTLAETLISMSESMEKRTAERDRAREAVKEIMAAFEQQLWEEIGVPVMTDDMRRAFKKGTAALEVSCEEVN